LTFVLSLEIHTVELDLLAAVNNLVTHTLIEPLNYSHLNAYRDPPTHPATSQTTPLFVIFSYQFFRRFSLIGWKLGMKMVRNEAKFEDSRPEAGREIKGNDTV
jgi:hypothetical protein